MKVLLVTEKCNPSIEQRDGGSRVVNSLKKELKDSLSVMQFGHEEGGCARWNFCYPNQHPNRFIRRLLNADFIGEKVKEVEEEFTHIIFAHVSMQFGQLTFPLNNEKEVWTFPMFLTPSYRLSGESVPEGYFEKEQKVLSGAKNILTPSYLEKQQLMQYYSIPEHCIHVVPRGVEMAFLDPHPRALGDPIKFCSLGSIKPQKGTLDLVRLFAKLRKRFLSSTLTLIGPVQDESYYQSIQEEVTSLGLREAIHFNGYVSPESLHYSLKGMHFHLSLARCETFGRAIFETLASGLPNIVKRRDNAAAEFLENAPYIHFIDHDEEMISSIEKMIPQFNFLSEKAQEIGTLFSEKFLSQLMVAKLLHKELVAISDFDGTLYHKNDATKTERSMEAFKKFPMRIICTARGTQDILEKISRYGLQVDWIISYSGGVVSDGKGKIQWISSFPLPQVEAVSQDPSNFRRIEYGGRILQLACKRSPLGIEGVRRERYEGETFIMPWSVSKFRAVHRLLNHIKWSGRVKVFGDGPSDEELIRYFDGTLIDKYSMIKEVDFV